jgi:major membrane immunogen (membrane-anchored lipoprotein)
MKKSLVITSIIFLSALLAACSSKTAANNFNGTWEKANGESGICWDSFTFSGKDSFEIKNSRVQGGEHSSGTYKLIEGTKYQFDYGMGSDMFNIEIKGNTMKVQRSSNTIVCKYNKAK